MQKYNKKIYIKAFTLAEVLITLAIIGVVAALTIPTVVQNYQKTQVVTQLKKTFSALSNTTNLAIADYGPITGWETGEGFSSANSIAFANKYLIPYLKVAKNCEAKITDDCAFNYTYLSKTTTSSFGSYYTRFYLTDGTLIAVESFTSESENGGTNRLAYVFIDVNGQKKPNIFGKDIFRFTYWINYPLNTTSNGTFKAYGQGWTRNSIINTEQSYGCRKDKTGELCAALIMTDGWQIKDDYPW
jgi:prepilin-type N-terminal cleavage/methylation domain-containing protein